jgi:serine phosphatase RsbU (regulator of sigma subunit)
MVHGDHSVEMLDKGNGPPVGFLEDGEYKAVMVGLRAGSRAVVMSDGIVEQFEAQPRADGERRQFEMEGVKRVIAGTPGKGDVVAAVMRELIAWAGTEALSDDATMVVTSW